MTIVFHTMLIAWKENSSQAIWSTGASCHYQTVHDREQANKCQEEAAASNSGARGRTVHLQFPWDMTWASATKSSVGKSSRRQQLRSSYLLPPSSATNCDKSRSGALRSPRSWPGSWHCVHDSMTLAQALVTWWSALCCRYRSYRHTGWYNSNICLYSEQQEENFLRRSPRNRSGKQVKRGGRTEIRVPVLLLCGVQYRKHPA